MIRSCALIFAGFLLFRCTLQQTTSEVSCGKSSGYIDRTVKISLNSKRNETGEWFDTLIARMESSDSSDSLNLDVTHRVTECEGKRVVFIKGVTKDTSGNETKLKFHPRSGKNIAVSNKGFTIQRINIEDAIHSAAFTYRPLRNNELFEVVIEKRIAKWTAGTGIGVTPISPANIDIVPEMYKSPDIWMQYNTKVFSNGKPLFQYNAKDIDKLQVGDRVGVMKTEFGVLHFFVNGIDQGPAVSNIPQTVYGVVDLRHNDVKATIVTANYTSQQFFFKYSLIMVVSSKF